MAITKALLVDVSTNRKEEDHRQFILYKFPFRAGRESRSPKRLANEGVQDNLQSHPNNDLYIRDTGSTPSVSREHFLVDLRDGEFYVVDRGSTLGTIVNGERIGGNKRPGRVKLERKENSIIVGSEGSPFRFKLILYPEALRAKILVADDDPNTVQMLTDVLEAQGYEAVSADNGVEAVRKTFSERPDLILLDWMIPQIEGIEICRHVKSNPTTSHIPIVILTARVDSEDKVIGFEVGADDFMAPPFDAHEVGACIKRLLTHSLRTRTIHAESGLPRERAFREEVNIRLLDEKAAETVSILLIRTEGLGSYGAQYGQVEAEELLSAIWRVVGAIPAHVGAPQTIVGHLADNLLAILTLTEWAPKLEASLHSNLVRRCPAMSFDIRSVSNENKVYSNVWQMLEAQSDEAQRESFGLFGRRRRP